MSDSNPVPFDYEMIKQFLASRMAQDPAAGSGPEYIRHIAGQIGLSGEYVERLVEDLAPPFSHDTGPQIVQKSAGTAKSSDLQPGEDSEEASPFLLVNLEKDLQPGFHHNTEFHVIFSGWDGDIQIEASLHGALDRTHWNDKPRLTPEAVGYSIFHQTLFLSYNGAPCPPGTYRLEFDCHFRNSNTRRDSAWRGWFEFAVHGPGSTGPELEIVSDGYSIVDLCGVNLKQFSRLKFQASGSSAVSLKSFLLDVENEAAKNVQATGSRAKMVPIALRPLGRRGPDDDDDILPLPHHTARFELPGGKRLVLFAQDRVMLGRNRPNPDSRDSREMTDIALRMYPRTKFLDGITQCISKQHLAVSACDGKLILEDPRRPESREAYPATVNHAALSDPISFRHVVNRVIQYRASMGAPQTDDPQPRQIGLEFSTFSEPHNADRILAQLKTLSQGRSDFAPWLRDAADLDAVLIERRGNPDELNDLEAYLLVLGVVFIGSDTRCPIRLSDPSVKDLHAALCHWDGLFRIMPMGNADIRCNGRRIHPGRCGTLKLGKSIHIGNVELLLEQAAQYGL